MRVEWMDRCGTGLTGELGGAQELLLCHLPQNKEKQFPSGGCVQPALKLLYSGPGRLRTWVDLALGVQFQLLAITLAQPQFLNLHHGEANATVAGARAPWVLVPNLVPCY